jgi:aspartyl-tRNA synthetase
MTPRTHYCNDLRADHVGQTATLAGWVQSYRDHGGVIFIDLRDRQGITQVVFHPENADAHAAADRLRHEDVVGVTGEVVAREAGMANPKLPTGEIELEAKTLEVLGKAQTPPFTPEMAERTNEELRLKHRYIDLRRPRMQHILQTRHRTTKAVRDFCDEHGFLEIETPFLCRSTPEGARDYLVPSRLEPGSFYALPQSPQLFKQILMVGGAERYLQIVRCFRDEDPRADRQAEFTQIDMEMSFVDQEQVMQLAESMIRHVWKKVLDKDVPEVRRMSYAEAVGRFGSDRPDLRFDLELVDITDIAGRTDFKVFKGAIDAGGVVKAIRVPGGASMSRKETDALAEWVKQFGAGGLPVTKVEGGKLATGIAKFLELVTDDLIAKVEASDGDLIVFGTDASPTVVHRVLGELRVKLAKDLGLIEDGRDEWVWIVDFPLLEKDPGGERFHALHHPFTAPTDADLDKLESDTLAVGSKAYDLVLNGSELGGGSIRIHRPEVQQRVLQLLGIDEQQARQQFGFLLDALNYGAPPHGGIAFGLDRMVMHLVGTENIRDVIAFPKTQTGQDLMTEAPAPVDAMQLKELSLRVQTHHQAAHAGP